MTASPPPLEAEATSSVEQDDDWLTGQACPVDAGEDCEACQ